jgi:hypothetical protein
MTAARPSPRFLQPNLVDPVIDLGSRDGSLPIVIPKSGNDLNLFVEKKCDDPTLFDVHGFNTGRPLCELFPHNSPTNRFQHGSDSSQQMTSLTIICA